MTLVFCMDLKFVTDQFSSKIVSFIASLLIIGVFYTQP
jgi:hypothetical protein